MSMRIACIAFTKRALALARSIRDCLVAQGDVLTLSCPSRLADDEDMKPVESMGSWTRQAWEQADALLFVSATGIAVRTIAPLVRDKYDDPAVVCVDEAASYVIPLLSGHVGGANALACRVAQTCDARVVVTTATDVNGLFAVDEWACQQGLAILDRDEAKRVSAELLDGHSVGFASDVAVEGVLPHGVVGGGQAALCETGFSVSVYEDSRPFEHTLRLVPRTVVVGVGCKRSTSAERILELVDACLAEAHVAPEAVCALASIDVKAEEPGLVEAAHLRGWELRFYDAQRLSAVLGEFQSSEFVRKTVGVDNVCERAACAEGATLLLSKRSAKGVSVALASTQPLLSFDAVRTCVVGEGAHLSQNRCRADERPDGEVPLLDAPKTPCVTCVGLGPGGGEDLTLRADVALQRADVIVGYTTYVNLIREAYPQAEFVTTGMRGEVERCRMALERAAQGMRVVVVCSGDPGVYGMAGLLLELVPAFPGVQVEVIPGVTAANGGAAVLGAPLMHDWCCISLSDLMTPWEVIEARLCAAAAAGLVIVLYNPASHGRAGHLRRACDVLLEHLGPSTQCGLVRNIGREGQTSATLSLGELRDAHVDMLTCVFVGNEQTRLIGGRMVTPRGYEAMDADRQGRLIRPAAVRRRRAQTALVPADMHAASFAPSLLAHPQGQATVAWGDTSRFRSVLVFGGTTEGRLIAQWLSGRGSCEVLYCTTTEYGASLVAGARVTTIQGPLSREEKDRLLAEHDVACIVDATHPYAEHISASIDELARDHCRDVVRVARADSTCDGMLEDGPLCTNVANAQEAAQLVAVASGNVLLTTGTNDLASFVEAMDDYRERLYVRILPVGSSLAKVEELGIPASHIVAMQGPFSVQLNCALIRALGIATVVTKRSGRAGGFDQKVEAARECGARLVVIGRPAGAEGISLAEAQRLLEVNYGL